MDRLLGLFAPALEDRCVLKADNLFTSMGELSNDRAIPRSPEADEAGMRARDLRVHPALALLPDR